MNNNDTINNTTSIARELWNSMSITSRILAIPMLALLLVGGFFTGILVLSMSMLLSAYSQTVNSSILP